MSNLIQKLIMYHKIHQMKGKGLKDPQISRELELDPRTVKKYLSMSESEYLKFIENQNFRSKELLPFTEYVKERLKKHSDTSAAQIHDLLKENFKDFPKVCPKTVYNFVMWIRREFSIPKESASREFMIVEPLPFGQQAQVDWGEYNMRRRDGSRIKVHFFSMVLSASRYKFVYFRSQHFTTATTIEAHEKAFAFFKGIPEEVVYDQDTLLLSDENKGDYILTEGFRAYTASRGFKLHFCRKADPQSKGKIENVVKYVKQNFLYNRVFDNIDSLNIQALAWLERTANTLPHGTTKKAPYDQWIKEIEYLQAYFPIELPGKTPKPYTVRINNTVDYGGNFYSLPMGTYKKSGTVVFLQDNGTHIFLFDQQENIIATHKKPVGKGHVIRNTDHKRDRTKSLEELVNQVCVYFSDTEKALVFIGQIKARYPRYTRDHLTALKKQLPDIDKTTADQVLEFCLENQIYSSNQVADIIAHFKKPNKNQENHTPQIKPLSVEKPDWDGMNPAKSDIETYHTLMTDKKN